MSYLVPSRFYYFWKMVLDSKSMKPRSFHLDSWNIRGEPLMVTCRSSSCLSCEIEVSLKSTDSSFLGLISLFSLLVVVVIGTVTLWILDVQSSMSVWVIFLCFLSLLIMWIKYNYFDVTKESVIIVKNIGIQIKSTYKSGKQAVQFVDHKSIADIIINEAITMNKVIFYLAILTKIPGKNKENTLKLIPLFTSFYPRLEGLKPIYHSIRSVIYEDEQEEFPAIVKQMKPGKIS